MFSQAAAERWLAGAGVLAALMLLGATPSRAADEPPTAPQSVALEAVALPVIVDGRLINYVFVSVRLDLSPKADGPAVRAKEPYFRDDLVRAGYRTPFTLATDYTHVDEAKIRAQVARAAVTLVGPGIVRAVAITKQASQHASQLPTAPQPSKRRVIDP